MSTHFLNDYFVKKALAEDAKLLLFEAHGAFLTAKEVLERQSLVELVECSPKTLQHLNQLVFLENSAIRRLGIADEGELKCITSGPEVHLKSDDFHALFEGSDVSERYYFMPAWNSSGSQTELLLVREVDEKQIFASITPFLVGHLEQSRCTDCLSYKLKIKGKSTLTSRSASLDSPYIESQASWQEGPIDISVTLVADKNYYDSYRQISMLGTFLFALVVASILTALFYKLMERRQSFDKAIVEGIRRSEFLPYYQPIVDSRTDQVVGAEVLVRWAKQGQSLIPPYQFIPYAEDSGLIIPITNQLLDKVVQDIDKLGWNDGSKFVSLNIVPEHLTDMKLFDRIKEQCEKFKIVPSTISLEITERRKVSDLVIARSILDEFYRIGIDLKLDDAGTGYGAFSYIQELGINSLKIDKMFIDTIQVADVKHTVLDAIISFVQTSNLDAIAEGVESEEQIDYLKQRGVFKIQGYVYSKPLPFTEFKAWLK